MTVKELKAFLATVPDEASVEFNDSENLYNHSWSEPNAVRVTFRRQYVPAKEQKDEAAA